MTTALPILPTDPVTAPVMAPVVIPPAVSSIPISTPLPMITTPQIDNDEFSDFFTNFNQDLFPIPPPADTVSTTGHTSVDITSIDYLISEVLSSSSNGDVTALAAAPLQIYEDGGYDAGCGGKLWVAGKLLSLYLIKHYTEVEALHGHGIKKIVELGSGTGVVGLALGLLLQNKNQTSSRSIKMFLTDLPQVIPILDRNIASNRLSGICSAQELDWCDTENVPGYLTDDGDGIVDLVLVADCVYDEKLFEILINTLKMLCALNHVPGDEDTTVLFTFRKRRRSNMRFFKNLRKWFSVEEIVAYEGYEEFQKQRCHLFKLVMKR